MLGDNIEIGGLFNLQSTKLELGGDRQPVDIADDKVYNYHGYIAYNFGDPAAHVRPYFLGGLGSDAVRRHHDELRRRPARARRRTRSSRPPGRSA